jgi:hypothetical protein
LKPLNKKEKDEKMNELQKKQNLHNLICTEKIKLYVERYCIPAVDDSKEICANAECIAINNDRLECHSHIRLKVDDVLRAYLFIPKYWELKKELVKHHFIYTPQKLKLIGKVKNKYTYLGTKVVFFNIDIVAADPVDNLVIANFIDRRANSKT